MPTSLRELGLELTDAQLDALAFNCSFKGTRTIGSFKKLDQADMLAIHADAREGAARRGSGKPLPYGRGAADTRGKRKKAPDCNAVRRFLVVLDSGNGSPVLKGVSDGLNPIPQSASPTAPFRKGSQRRASPPFAKGRCQPLSRIETQRSGFDSERKKEPRHSAVFGAQPETERARLLLTPRRGSTRGRIPTSGCALLGMTGL